MDKEEQVLKSLTNQLPQYFRPIIEFQEILKAHSFILSKLNFDLGKIRANFYIATCDEDTISYYEKILGIVNHFGDTLDFRRIRVLQKLNTIVPFCIEFLRDKLIGLYGENGYVIDVDPLKSELKIKITSDRYGAVDLLYDLLWDVVPAHVKIVANQQATKYIPGKIYVGGRVTGNTFVQTIHYKTTQNTECNMNVAGDVLGIVIQTIGQGGIEYGSV